jgi:hypothetical protein
MGHVIEFGSGAKYANSSLPNFIAVIQLSEEKKKVKRIG